MTFLAAAPTHLWYLDPVFLPAATGFIGVLVGAIITAVSSYMLDERRDERERQRQCLNRQIEAKRAARMIDENLGDAEAYAGVALKNNNYWATNCAPLKLDGWNQYKAALATALSSESWTLVRVGIIAIRHLNQYRELDAQDPGADPILPKMSIQLTAAVSSALDDIREARTALVPCLSDNAGM